ncbi:MAG: HEAT repeat domain-containing protein, partial [Halobacteriaceae archaeon]
MSDGDEEDQESAASEEQAPDLDEETFEKRLDDVAESLETAETEAELDEVEEILNEIESDLDRADLPEPEDEEEESPVEAIQDRIDEIRS